MTPANKARLVALVAFPAFLLHAGPGRCAPVAAAAAPAVTTLDHISVAVTGRGSPVVLIPGLSSPRATWDGVVPTLAAHHTVYTVQVNGFGGEAPGANLKPGVLDGVVADLAGYLSARHVAPVAVVGHSLGGLVALMLAKAHPMQVSRAMIVDALPFYGALFGPQVTVAMVEPRGRAMRDQIAAGYGKPADPASAEATANGLALKHESRAKVKAWAMAADPRVTTAAMYEDLTTDLRPQLASIATPLTIVYPWDATNRPKAMAEATYRGAYAASPHVSYIDIADSAHFAMLDQPIAFQAALDAFVDGK